MKGKKQYKSCLANTDIEKLTKEEQIELLVEKEIFTVMKVFSFKTEELDLKKGNHRSYGKLENRLSDELIEEFYIYLQGLYKDDIDTFFYLFFKDFNDKVYGMHHSEQRIIALEMFKAVYDSINVTDISFIHKETSVNGIENIVQENRFQRLKGFRSGKKTHIAKYESIIAYLIGNEDYFRTSKFMQDEVSESFLTFERFLKILISLNDRYDFEDDFVFSKLGVLKETFQKYQNIFVNFDAFIFTNNFIENLQQNKPSSIDSLHQALIESNLISSKKESFIIYVNTEHEIPITKVRNYARDINRSHDFRLKKIKKELGNITPKD